MEQSKEQNRAERKTSDEHEERRELARSRRTISECHHDLGQAAWPQYIPTRRAPLLFRRAGLTGILQIAWWKLANTNHRPAIFVRVARIPAQ
jgi:hypothetical protein